MRRLLVTARTAHGGYGDAFDYAAMLIQLGNEFWHASQESPHFENGAISRLFARL